MWVNWFGDPSAGSGGSLINVSDVVRARAVTVTGSGTVHRLELHHSTGSPTFIEFPTTTARDAAFEELKLWLGSEGFYVIGETGDVLNPFSAGMVYIDINNSSRLRVDSHSIDLSTSQVAQDELQGIKDWLGERRIHPITS